MMLRSSLEIGVAASAGAALLLSTGTIIQALDARQVDSAHGLRISLLGRLVRRRRWVAGTVVGYLAFPLQLIALAHAPLVIVQPLHACGLLLLLAAGARLLKERVHVLELAGALAIVAGMAIVTWGAPAGADPAVSQAALAGAVAGLVLLAFAPYAIGVHCGKVPLIFAAAVGFAGANMAVKGVSDGISAHEYLVAGGYLTAAAVGSSVGVMNQMTAFQRHRAAEVVPITFAIPTFLPALVGLAVLQQHWGTATLDGVPFALGAALLLLGTAAVARSAPVTRVARQAE
jgi:drug/metabolite transporter (DMT)-like permease